MVELRGTLKNLADQQGIAGPFVEGSGWAAAYASFDA